MNSKQPAQGKRNQSRLRGVIRVIVLLLPAAIYLPTLTGNAAVPPGQGSYSDLLITHYPYLHYLRTSLIDNQQIPLWSTLIQAGAPFAANPLAGVFYLPGWIAMLFQLPAGISLAMAAHQVFGAWGMYRYLQAKRIGETGSLVGALGFGLMPKLAAHFGAGHVTLIYAVSWTPWLLLSFEKGQRGWKAGIIAGMLFLADPRWTVYAGALLLTKEIAHRQILVGKRWSFYLEAALAAVLIGAPLLVPMLEYLKLATRMDLAAGDVLFGSLPAPNIIGLIIPGSGGNIEWYSYAGGILLGLFISQLFFKEIRKINCFWTAWIGASIILASGAWGLGANWINSIPMLNLLRVPARSLFVTGICLAVIAAQTIDYFSMVRMAPYKHRAVHFAVSALGLLLLVGAAVMTRIEQVMILWGFLFLAAAGVVLLAMERFPTKDYLQWTLVGLLAVDLLGAGLASYQIQGKEIRQPGEGFSVILDDQAYFRIYSPSYSVPQYLAAEYALELADGVDPLQLVGYVKVMERASGVPQDGYSVTIPPFRTGNPSLDNIDAVIDSELLGILNVKYIVSAFPIEAPGLTALQTSGERKIYLNDNAMPRAWVEGPGNDQMKMDRSSQGQANIIEKTANRILLEASGPGRLVVSEVDYPGWQVMVDGKREELEIAWDILRSVYLEDGEHQVSFVFRPLSVYIGLALGGLGWIGAGYLYGRKEIA